MAIRYNLTHYDDKNNENVVEIYDDGFLGHLPTEIEGYAVLKSGKVEEIASIFKGTGLELNIQANAGRKFDEFFTSDERTFKVIYKRNGSTLFIGWIEPEGYYESFTADTWFIQVNCLDGLSYLENLSYVQPSGLIWSGQQTALEIITNALERTNLDLDVFTNIDVFYTGADENEDILGNIYFNVGRFYRDDGETIMSCEDVLKDLLRIFGASIIQYNGRWLIYKINQLYTSQIPAFWMYDYQGTPKLGLIYTPGLILRELGSQINNFPLFHCNTNQQLGLEKGIGSLRIYYEYGFLKELVSNPYLVNDGVTLPGWSIIDNSVVELNYNTTQEIIPLKIIASSAGDVDALKIDPTFELQESNSFTIDISARVNNVFFHYMYINITLSSIIGGEWFINNNFEWEAGTNPDDLELRIYKTWGVINIETPPAPSDGDIDIVIIRKDAPFVAPVISYYDVYIREFSVRVSEKTKSNLKGEVWTFENEDITTSKIAGNIEVFNGDAVTDFFIGNIYKADGTTQTATWNRKGGSEELPILHLLGCDLMRLQQENALLFEGDVKGFVDYFSIVQIDGFDGLFTIMGYNYQAKEDITNLQLKRFFGDPITNLDIGDSPVNDYGNTVKPTIKG